MSEPQWSELSVGGKAKLAVFTLVGWGLILSIVGGVAVGLVAGATSSTPEPPRTTVRPWKPTNRSVTTNRRVTTTTVRLVVPTTTMVTYQAPDFPLDFTDLTWTVPQRPQFTPVAPNGGGGGGGGDLDCEDVGYEVYVGDYDPNDLDGDGDGWGCEGW